MENLNEKKQIEEMAKVIKSSLDGLGSGNFHFTGGEISTMFAKVLYNANYRKQSEGEWKSHKDFNPFLRTDVIVGYICSCCENESDETTKFCPDCGAKMFIRMTHTCPHNIPNLIPTIEEMKGGAE